MENLQSGCIFGANNYGSVSIFALVIFHESNFPEYV